MTRDGPSSLVPKLRHPDFASRPGWSRMKLSAIMKPHRLKSDGSSEVHSVSLAKGVVPQVEHMGRSYAANETSHYTLVRPFDVVYTRSPLADFKFGIVKQHKAKHNAIVSPLYGVFTPKTRHLGRLAEAYFDSPARSRAYLEPLAKKGAKNTIQLPDKEFLSGYIYLPDDPEEQQAVADCLDSIDALITSERQMLKALVQHKQGLSQKMFPRFLGQTP